MRFVSSVELCIIFLFGIIPFYPALCGLRFDFGKFYEQDNLDTSTHSLLVLLSWVSVVAGSVPCLLDSLFDYLTTSHIKGVHGFEIMFRIKVTSLVIISDVLLLLVAPSHIYVIPCIFKSREALFCYFVLSYLSSNFPSIIGPLPARMVACIVFAICTIDCSVSYVDPSILIVFVAKIIVIVLKIIVSLYLFWTFYAHYRRYVVHHESIDSYESSYLMARMCMLLFSTLVLSVWILNLSTGWRPWQENKPSFFIAYSFFVYLFSIGLTLTYWRITSKESAQVKVSCSTHAST